MLNFLLIIFAYLLGSIPFGLLVGKYFFHTDIRQIGSGNIGTTNAFRGLGKKGGVIVFLCDMAKGFLPVLLAANLTGVTWHPLIFGFFAVLGHAYPIYLKFKGGKAIATSLGLITAYNPLFALLAIICFAIVLYFFRMVSLSAIVAVFFVIILSIIQGDWMLTGMTCLIWLIVLIRHQENIRRIQSGTESKVPFGFGKK
ncbi:glycerol-3-phosphate 1-O-acyltransferase PlsY [Aerococcus kribbianus]|uniref:Glycerol-3-phosphate acyltransferase n=1 Tax=Aerococcus kribbianus TaxID=2999064 RepID=A0A9X3FLX8_9LACT|nr:MULTISPECIES: glycerol-3-phosphate 1-O-acyltransferase PlsY [unclassified Aerococcus]MCZ0716800.1 glycerol-3-phosphate 1-O-acyltransferase PlsY [Aerococcus sp. YH-aer221]MCZ0725088.1 glycerol-3-phosphate 1-O-acyltransferase PlsY [Aerococcus sp. YH-aer222]